jgi:hypothetical protein
MRFRLPRGFQFGFRLPKPLHGWRIFWGEVGIIVVGVLIAVSAEQLADKFDWAHKVSQAEENMRIEQRDDDLPQAYVRAAIGICLRDQLRAIRAMLDQPKVDRLKFAQMIAAYHPPIRTWDSQAWEAATDPELAAHMGPERRTQWAGVYNVMPRIQSLNWEEDAVLSEIQGVRRLSGNLSDQEVAPLVQQVAKLQSLNALMAMDSMALMASAEDVGVVVPPDIARRLDEKLHAALGSCVIRPNPKVSTTEGGPLDSRLPDGDITIR